MTTVSRITTLTAPFIEKHAKPKENKPILKLEDILISPEQCENQVYQSMRQMSWCLAVCSTSNLIKLLKSIKKQAYICFKDGNVERSSNPTPKDISHFEADKIAKYLNDFLTLETQDQITLGLRQEIKTQLCNKVCSCIERLNFDQLATTASALEFVKCQDVSLFRQLTSRIDQQWPKQKLPQSLTALTWVAFGLRNENVRNLTVFDKIADSFRQPDIDNLSNQDLVRLAKSFTYAKFKNQRLFACINRSAQKRDFTSCEAADLYWSYAYIVAKDYSQGGGYDRDYCRHLIGALKACILKHRETLNPNQITRITWCEKVFKIDDPEFLAAIKEPTKRLIPSFTKEELLTSLKSFCQMKKVDRTVLESLIHGCKDKIDEFKPTELTQMAYGLLAQFCALKTSRFELKDFIKLILERIFAIDPKQFNDEDLCRINSVYRIYIGKAKDEQFEMPSGIIEALLLYFISRHKPIEHSSTFHKEVAAYLSKIKPGFENECNFYGFSLDMAYVNEKIAWEVDGDLYHKDQNNLPLAKERIKETLLEIEGWKLHRICSSEWPKSNEERFALLQRKMQE